MKDSFSKNYFNFLSLIIFPKVFSDCSRGLGYKNSYLIFFRFYIFGSIPISIKNYYDKHNKKKIIIIIQIQINKSYLLKLLVLFDKKSPIIVVMVGAIVMLDTKVMVRTIIIVLMNENLIIWTNHWDEWTRYTTHFLIYKFLYFVLLYSIDATMKKVLCFFSLYFQKERNVIDS